MTNIQRFAKNATPAETFREHSPAEHRFLTATIVRLTETNDATAEYLLQEIINKLYRSADERLREMGIRT
jgi:hypothetical protein